MRLTPHGPGALPRQPTCAVRCAVSNHEETYNSIPRDAAKPPPLHVIASAAKQSILSLRGKMDCFASLAMTAESVACRAVPSPLHVIASAAKQSILSLRGKMDCLATAPWRPGPN